MTPLAHPENLAESVSAYRRSSYYLDDPDLTSAVDVERAAQHADALLKFAKQECVDITVAAFLAIFFTEGEREELQALAETYDREERAREEFYASIA